MKISYTFHVEGPLHVPDHWPIPAFGGTMTLVEADGLVTGIKVSFEKQPVALSPEITELDQGEIRSNITFRDGLLHKSTEDMLRRALSIVQCFFPFELALGVVTTDFEAETEEEKAAIHLYQFARTRQIHTTEVSFDMISRAVWAAEAGADASFIAGLNVQARNSLSEERYINSFRYSFMAIEAEYGNGQFKSDKLKSTLKASQPFREALASGVEGAKSMPSRQKSATDDIVLRGDLDEVIDHLVERRGHYFHGNRRKREAWHPNEQGEAEALATLGVNILSAIAAQHAEPMFEAELGKRHYDEAIKSGAQVTLSVLFHYKRRERPYLERRRLRMNYPGNGPSPLMAMDALKNFLAEFEKGDPLNELVDAKCIDEKTGREVFNVGITNEVSSIASEEPIFSK